MPTNSFQTLRELLVYAGAFRRRIIMATICSVANKILDIMPEVLIGVAIDVVIRKQDSFVATLGISDPFHQLLFLGVITLFVWAGESLFEYLYLVLWRMLAQDLQHEARIDAYNHAQHLDLTFFDKSSTGNLTSILNDDVNQLERFLDGGANSLIQVLTTVVVIGGIFFAVSPVIAAIAFTPVPVIIIGAFYFQKRAQPLYRKVRDQVGVLSARLSENLSGIQTIKSFTAEKFELRKLSSDSREYVEANREAIRISSAFIPVIRMAILAGFLATMLIGGWFALNDRLNIGSYSALVYLTQRLLWPLTGLAQVVDLFERAMASTKRILNLLNTEIQIRDPANAISLVRVNGHIRIDDLAFNYRTSGPVFAHLNLNIPAGTTAAFVGPTGSGKSTIIKLLMRFYSPNSGRILIDDTDIRDFALTNLRSHMGLVAQDTYLFPGTVRENIAYGHDIVDEARILEAATVAEAMDFIRQLPDGFETLVGERGQRLSGGQRQRLSIARALYKNPSILILDEATSAVDNETEAVIQRSLEAISKNRTTLIVAHRLSTIVNADAIYVMDQGRIVESGTHEELSRQDGMYRNLWNVQTGNRIKE